MHTDMHYARSPPRTPPSEAMDDVLHQRLDGSWQNRFGLLLTYVASVMSRALLGRDARPYGYTA
jgi:hypothetical protein